MPESLHPAHQRVLETAERKGVKVEIVTFSESTHTAAEAAAAVGAELGQIVKSLVFVAPTEAGMEAVVALVSGANRVDIARLAAVVGLPSLRRASAQEAGDATGFVIGGIPPFAHRRPVRIVMDPDLGRYPMVWAAAGTPNAVFTVPPATLRMLSNATVAPLAEDVDPEIRPTLAAAPRVPPRPARDRCVQRVSSETDGGASTGRDVLREPRRSAVQYPGGLSARYRWTGSGGIASLIAMSEAGGTLTDHGPLVSDAPDRLCRAELRVEGPTATWTARFASPIHDDPAGLLWDTQALLVVKYGFEVYALGARTGELRWHHASRTPVVAVLGSSRLTHVIVQTEIETVALAADGEPVWRAAHSDVVAEVDLVGGRLVLTSYAGLLQTLDPVTGRQLSG